MTRTPLPVAADVAAAADHGQWCPKLCSHTCPVLAATGRSDAVPWSFHRTVADLAQGRSGAHEAAARLVACAGCGACAGGCEVAGQDVPAQVRAGRTAVHRGGASLPPVATAAAAVAAGDSPHGVELPRGLGATRPDVVLLAGCRDTAVEVAAAVRLLAAAGEVAAVIVPQGCCGATLADLGAADEAAEAAASLDTRLPAGVPLLLLDPHCAPSIRDGAATADDEDATTAPRHLVAHLAALVADGRLRLRAPHEVVRWHEPCVLRGTAAAGAGPRLLAALGALVDLPGGRHHGCSGGGLGLPLLDPAAATAVAGDLAHRLHGPGPLVSACRGAVAGLADHDDEAVHVVTLLAGLIGDRPESVA